MTAADDVPNIILSKNAISVTVYTTSTEKIFNKLLTVLNPPQSSINWSSGPKVSKIMDLLRVGTRFSIRGHIESADETNLTNLFKGGGVFNLTWDGTDYNINMDKLSITKNNTGEQDKRMVQFTAIVGENI